ncbi:hypothetical protein CP556_20410 [Natrinema sp. CBA1119]|nr:hypothetical protein CP556_20410 [Natrinema sp. CBA1119]
MVVSEYSTQRDDLEPRTKRAVTGEMSVSLHEKGGRYEVQSESRVATETNYTLITTPSRDQVYIDFSDYYRNRHEIDMIDELYSCPD